MAVIGAAQCGSAHDRRTSFLQLYRMGVQRTDCNELEDPWTFEYTYPYIEEKKKKKEQISVHKDVHNTRKA